VQIIFNLFRQRPSELFFSEARKRRIGILARLPLSSGMLSGKMNSSSRFEKEDHRNFNRQGAGFDRGETFSGLDYELGLKAVNSLRTVLPRGLTLAQLALRWILMFPEVSCAIPGAKRPQQVRENVAAADPAPLNGATMDAIRTIYETQVREHVHHYW